MSVDQHVRPGVAAELDALAPGAELVAALDRLSPATLTGEDLAAYLRGCARVQNRGTSRLLDAMHHLGRAQADRLARRPELDEFSGDEVAAVLGLGRTMVARKLDLADDLRDRLPDVGDALWHGVLDEHKAARLCEWTRDLCDDHARHVARVLLPEAPALPPAELIRRIEKTATELDPDWAARRTARAEKNARVILSPNPTGTATFSVCDVAAPRGLAMRDRCDAVAALVRGLGVLTPIGSLRAEVAGRLLDGSVEGMTDHQVALLLASEYHQHRRADDGPDDGPDDGQSPGPDDGPSPGPDADGGPKDGPDHDGGPEDGPVDVGGPADGPQDPGDGPQDSEGDVQPDDQGVLDLPDLPDQSRRAPAEGRGSEKPLEPPAVDGPDRSPGHPRTGTSELRLRLSTALGLDDSPATVPGYGTVLAHHARTLLDRYRTGEWRIVLTDDDGRLDGLLLARRRPSRPRRPDERRRGQGCTAIVEIQVPTTWLAALRPADHPLWAALLRELQLRLRELGPRLGRPPTETAADHARRRPRVEIERWVRVRDRHCVVPGCYRPARRADIDHTRDWALRGPTAERNLGVFCRHHHRAKHLAGWRVHQPSPGRFAFRTRAGVHHTTYPKRILEPLVRPRPGPRPRPLPDDGFAPDAAHDPETEAADDLDWRRRFLRRTTGHAAPAPTPARATTIPTDDDPPPF